mmetsp:Transcript_3336/g.5455  ORF Transcript_3336/g.5455 Transcript_3336/m.5455 type:complete len:370 (-) Transcript_3336:1475-2584(-)
MSLNVTHQATRIVLRPHQQFVPIGRVGRQAEAVADGQAAEPCVDERVDQIETGDLAATARVVDVAVPYHLERCIVPQAVYAVRERALECPELLLGLCLVRRRHGLRLGHREERLDGRLLPRIVLARKLHAEVEVVSSLEEARLQVRAAERCAPLEHVRTLLEQRPDVLELVAEAEVGDELLEVELPVGVFAQEGVHLARDLGGVDNLGEVADHASVLVGVRADVVHQPGNSLLRPARRAELVHAHRYLEAGEARHAVRLVGGHCEVHVAPVRLTNRLAHMRVANVHLKVLVLHLSVRQLHTRIVTVGRAQLRLDDDRAPGVRAHGAQRVDAWQVALRRRDVSCLVPGGFERLELVHLGPNVDANESIRV